MLLQEPEAESSEPRPELEAGPNELAHGFMEKAGTSSTERKESWEGKASVAIEVVAFQGAGLAVVGPSAVVLVVVVGMLQSMCGAAQRQEG